MKAQVEHETVISCRLLIWLSLSELVNFADLVCLWSCDEVDTVTKTPGVFRDTLILLVSQLLSSHLPAVTRWHPSHSHLFTKTHIYTNIVSIISSKAPNNINNCGSEPPQSFLLCILLFNQQEAPEYSNTRWNADDAVSTIWSLVLKNMSCDSKLIFRKDCTDWSKHKKLCFTYQTTSLQYLTLVI